MDSVYLKQLRTALTDIQLFGTLKQIDLINTGFDSFDKTQRLPLDSILNDLRNTLRDELNLQHVKTNIMFLKYENE